MTKYSERDVGRFLEKVRKTPDCWEWTASDNGHGYGQFYLNGTPVGAHRAAYEFFIGSIPDGLMVLHSCDNPACVNPAHLFAGTAADNSHDMVTKKRGNTGEWNRGGGKLKESDIPEIRRRRHAGERLAEIAADYGVSDSMISMIASRRKWAYVP